LFFIILDRGLVDDDLQDLGLVVLGLLDLLQNGICDGLQGGNVGTVVILLAIPFGHGNLVVNLYLVVLIFQGSIYKDFIP